MKFEKGLLIRKSNLNLGKCACGDCKCGRCEVKCKGKQQKPPAFDVKWQSSYSRSYNWNSKLNKTISEINSLKF